MARWRLQVIADRAIGPQLREQMRKDAAQVDANRRNMRGAS